MTGYNPENERVKKQYEEALLHGRHREPRTVDAVWKAINLFEQFTDRMSFKSFRTIEKTVMTSMTSDVSQRARVIHPFGSIAFGRWR